LHAPARGVHWQAFTRGGQRHELRRYAAEG